MLKGYGRTKEYRVAAAADSPSICAEGHQLHAGAGTDFYMPFGRGGEIVAVRHSGLTFGAACHVNDAELRVRPSVERRATTPASTAAP